MCVCLFVCVLTKYTLQDCAGWTVLGTFILLLGPLGFLVLAGLRILHHIHTGDLAYEEAPRPTWADLKSAVSEAKGCGGKIKAVQGFYGECIARGEWNSDNPHARHWGFVLGDMTKFGFIYALFLIGKRVYVSGTLILTDGRPNAVMSMVGQTLDSVLLICLRPFNDAQVTTTEAIAGIGNVAAYFALGLPVIMGPDYYLGDVYVLLISVFGVAISAVTSMLGTVSQLVEGASACVSRTTECMGGGVGLGAGLGGSELVAEAANVVAEGAQAAAEEAMEGEEETVGLDENIVGASAVGLAYGLIRGIARGVHSETDQPGLKWHSIGAERPKRGSEIHNDALATALTHQSEFSSEELSSFHEDNLSFSSYIKVGDTYFQPCVETADVKVADAKVADTAHANESAPRLASHDSSVPEWLEWMDFSKNQDVSKLLGACGCGEGQVKNDNDEDSQDTVRIMIIERTQSKGLRDRAMQHSSAMEREQMPSNPPNTAASPDSAPDTDPSRPARVWRSAGLERDPNPFVVAPTFPASPRIPTLDITDPMHHVDRSTVGTCAHWHTCHMHTLFAYAGICMCAYVDMCGLYT